MNQFSLIKATCICSISLFCLLEVVAFENHENNDKQLTVEQETAINKKIQSLSASAISAKDFSTAIDECHRALAKPVSETSRKYIQSVLAWCLNQRGAKRLDLSADFNAINNKKQADATALAAKKDFDDSIAAAPGRWSAYLNRAVFHAQRHEYTSALKDLDQSLDIKADLYKALANRAEIHHYLQKYELAVNDYESLLKYQPGNIQAITGRAHCWMELSKFKDALKEYEIVTRLKPGDPIALVNRGDAHAALGNWQAAYDDYVASFNLKPTCAACHRAAWLLATCPEMDHYQPETALDLAKKAIGLDKESAHAHDALAAAHAALGQFKEAIAAQEKAIDLMQMEADEFKKRLALYRQNKAWQLSDPKQK